MKRLASITFLFLCVLSFASFAAEFSFAVFGDNENGDHIFNDLIKEMNYDDTIRFAVNAGDITSGGTFSEYRHYWQMTKQANVKIYDTIGNHDIGPAGRGIETFKRKYGSTYYSFDYENARFIILDNAANDGFGEKQFAWLKEKLATDKLVFVFMHRPFFDITGTYPKHIMYPLKDAQRLEAMLEKRKVKYVFAGHIHGYAKEKLNGVVYVTTAGAGAPLYLPQFDGGFYHYVKMTVDGPNVEDEVVRFNK